MNTGATPTRNSDPYLALGVRPFINCCSVRTLHGGSLMLPQVRQAIASAASQFVNLDELMEAAGRRIAELTGAEWGMVTCGSAAALALATAACVAGNDPVKMLRLPRTDGLSNHVVMITGQRFAYDGAMRMVGTHIVECGTPAELEAALDTGLVAMVCVLGKQDARSALPIELVAALARPRGIPILVDAASEHIEQPNPWLARGADLVVYSGGKFLRGPQTSGLLLGAKPLVEAAWRNAAPHHAFGRPMKVSKEDVIGVIAALEYWFTERDAAAEESRWCRDLEEIADAVGQHQGISRELIAPEGALKVPSLRIAWSPDRHALTSLQLREALRNGTPRIMLDDTHATERSIQIEPFNLQPGEAGAVGAAIARAFSLAQAADHPTNGVVCADIAGVWDVTVEFLRGQRRHRLTLAQTGSELTGWQESPSFSGAVVGRIIGSEVEMRFEDTYEGSTIIYSFVGAAGPSGLGGSVQFGAANATNRGEFNLRQHGSGMWRASLASGDSIDTLKVVA